MSLKDLYYHGFSERALHLLSFPYSPRSVFVDEIDKILDKKDFLNEISKNDYHISNQKNPLFKDLNIGKYEFYPIQEVFSLPILQEGSKTLKLVLHHDKSGLFVGCKYNNNDNYDKLFYLENNYLNRTDIYQKIIRCLKERCKRFDYLLLEDASYHIMEHAIDYWWLHNQENFLTLLELPYDFFGWNVRKLEPKKSNKPIFKENLCFCEREYAPDKQVELLTNHIVELLSKLKHQQIKVERISDVFVKIDYDININYSHTQSEFKTYSTQEVKCCCVHCFYELVKHLGYLLKQKGFQTLYYAWKYGPAKFTIYGIDSLGNKFIFKSIQSIESQSLNHENEK